MTEPTPGATVALSPCHACGRHVRIDGRDGGGACPFCGVRLCEPGACQSGPVAERRAGRVASILIGSATATVLAACYGAPGDPYPESWDADTELDATRDASDAANGSGDAGDASLDTADATDGSGDTSLDASE